MGFARNCCGVHGYYATHQIFIIEVIRKKRFEAYTFFESFNCANNQQPDSPNQHNHQQLQPTEKAQVPSELLAVSKKVFFRLLKVGLEVLQLQQAVRCVVDAVMETTHVG